MNKHLILKEKIEKEMLISNFDFEELEKRYEMGWLSGPVAYTGCGTKEGVGVTFTF